MEIRMAIRLCLAALAKFLFSFLFGNLLSGAYMPRTVVLLNARKEQITNSNPGSHPELQELFPQDLNQPMPKVIDWDGRRFDLMAQPVHVTDEPNCELFRYLEAE